jgi:Holliday junction resolvasome RuvABC endonuclease subunit
LPNHGREAFPRPSPENPSRDTKTSKAAGKPIIWLDPYRNPKNANSSHDYWITASTKNMKRTQSKRVQVLGIAPSSRGFGFAVIDGSSTLLDWGVKTSTGDKNSHALKAISRLIEEYAPTVLVMEDCHAAGARRAPRIQALVGAIEKMAVTRKVKMKLFSKVQIRQRSNMNKRATKQEMAEYLASRFPEELGHRLPRKRQPWMSEDYRMPIFDAVALAQCCIGR